ncbi:fimbrillin family protein [Phocaeicola plebeius]|jgi:hypothetical protein|uniref:fimbrillin family protein n=1 Tax=Phocaeicola plebeius TaxID=310297 RepID=UPI0026EB2A26|nr:fimbrillin family protein [Phocaeicola plebeius]
MKRTTIHISATLALLLALAACTQDEAGFLPEGAEGTPIVFTATGLNPDATATAGTRAPVDGNWEGVQSVAVRMDGTVKAYNVTPSISDNTSATLTSDEPYYWTNHNNITVTAWWPYTAGETTPPAVKVAADQSARKDFEGSDLIVAEEQTVSYGNPTLRFTHRTAQITVVLTNYTEGMASVRLTGLSTENGNPAEIAPYDKGGDTYTALVAPQSVAAGTAFITCAFNNGKTFAYRMQGAAEWKAGEEYTYTVSLAAAEDPGYTVSEDGNTYEVYNADGLLAWNKAVQGNLLLNCTLTDDINLTGKEWTPIGDYDNRYTGTFDGGNHTITGLTINQYGNYVGMIDFLESGGTVQNLTLESVNITGGDIVGSVVGDNYGTVTACTASGNVSGTSRIGGVVGYNNGTVTACYHASGNVSGTSYIGGVVGRNTSGTLTACYHASGNVSGTSNVGGVVGYNISGTLTACYWSGLPDNDNGGATKVDGTTVTWQNAVDAMNTALQSAGSEWRYELTGELPTLKKQ